MSESSSQTLSEARGAGVSLAIHISDRLQIPLAEIEISFTRSSGPGGQHVNKTSTRAEIAFDLAHSPSIPEADRAWMMGRLQSKLDTEGKLHIAAQEYRSQLRNRQAAIDRLEALLQQAILRPKKRKKSKPTRSAVERRLSSKKRESEKKRERRTRE
ncbi:MAG: alternative ribosome rescue aminoacyl-tRNA hydrolase ArfB [Bacteroidota bacterium]|nr:alternative ribosome rescue aminoacyl-tRNA hydrolase ArfB [Bacteroidota bacterium]MDP4231902.1 alternative ribosome rescue aminoacyl-tRNA hydrolase ArfB [Bacteroidota bacterium]MDP4241391.1 alternative ribosome rescue aminoacyl-tRNA hydrolase ArfB [Bacteroidota bacterium]MDP4287314.1 alternative ribosome rescue aminoacyl-tRNA hydrolase ArfB [Bacteroidota bacterium]